jgi:hypothetical protein
MLNITSATYYQWTDYYLANKLAPRRHSISNAQHFDTIDLSLTRLIIKFVMTAWSTQLSGVVHQAQKTQSSACQLALLSRVSVPSDQQTFTH